MSESLEGSLNDTSHPPSWKSHAERLLQSLRDIVGASITLDPASGEVVEVSVLAEGNRPPKQIVRDVRSALRAEFQVEVDYRRISVAQKRSPGAPAAAEEAPRRPTLLTLPASRVLSEPAVTRMQFVGVTVSIEQSRAHARVELALGDRESMGEASGLNTRREVPRLVAEATLAAVSKFLDDGQSFMLADLEVLRFAGEEVVLVGVKLFRDRLEKPLTGSCVVANDLQQSIVYASLDSINRILGRLRYKEPVEFELRPTTIS